MLPAWSRDLPGHGAVLAMHAFGLEESGEYEHAEQSARAALALDPDNARAHHVMAHVFEMTGRAEAGIRWLRQNAAAWAVGSTVARHCFWHLALFHLARGEIDAALALYDERIAPGADSGLADLIDASALLWRVHLRGVDAGARWQVLADAWAPFSDDSLLQLQRPARDAGVRRRRRPRARSPSRAGRSPRAARGARAMARPRASSV